MVIYLQQDILQYMRAWGLLSIADDTIEPGIKGGRGKGGGIQITIVNLLWHNYVHLT